jgi:hypothetical protein
MNARVLANAMIGAGGALLGLSAVAGSIFYVVQPGNYELIKDLRER